MDNFDLVATNLYLALARGEINTPLAKLKYNKQFVEQPIHSRNGPSFPPDVILFSKAYNHTLLLEIKNTTSTDFRTSQAQNYTQVTPDHFKIVFTGHRELNRLQIDFAYKAHSANEGHLAKDIKVSGMQLPLLILDLEKFEIRHSAETKRFDFGRLESVFAKPLKLPLKSIDEIPRLIHFTQYTDNYEILSYIVPTLISLARRDTDKISLLDLTKNCYSKLKIWDELDSKFKAELMKKIKTVLLNLKNYGLGDYIIYDTKEKSVKVDIFDGDGQKSQLKLAAIGSRITRPQAIAGAAQTVLV